MKMGSKSLPKLFYFIPFYGIYRIIIRMRALETALQALEREVGELKSEASGIKQDQNVHYKNVQFYEARIDGIYHKIMDLFSINPEDARIGKNNKSNIA